MTTALSVAPFGGDDTAPTGSDVVIVGGGIVGVLSALELAEAGISVTLCEKGVIAGEQSSRNWGWVRQMGRAEAELPLAAIALNLWRGMDARINGATGFRQTGIAYAAFTERDSDHWHRWHEIGTRHGIETRLLSGDQVRAMAPAIQGQVRMALWSPGDGCAEPWQSVPAMARAARSAGARILTHCAVRALDVEGGRVAGVITERGRIRARRVIVAGGVWSRALMGNHDIDFPQLRVVGTVARVTGAQGLPDHPFGTENFSFRPRLDGGHTLTLRNANVAPILPDSFRLFRQYAPRLRENWREFHLRVGADFFRDLTAPRHWSPDEETVFEACRVMDPKPSAVFLKRALRNAIECFPAFANVQTTHAWAGMIDVTPDAIPVIDWVPGLEGVFMASGCSGHGFGLGPAVARLTADLLLDRGPVSDPAPYRWNRFRPA
ncbi:D-amino acid oxidase [Salipiger aestuarii]|uniref:Glycine/D-amino acid oxidase-like deaminating enzyme n=1 Tax=Salipiger aestuarii TaxID=568098 RepID=A0A327YJX0_9RHOB|nr:FAD-binding oxidoreductase [Salipiger aestuarii]KAB2541403.1 D-amino acid oxidase [Salipiger aestuarii]RAK20055.1 glycine/D-amino acid oxidase-like deaminating enzyme [Salipiger aestuarii]